MPAYYDTDRQEEEQFRPSVRIRFPAPMLLRIDQIANSGRFMDRSEAIRALEITREGLQLTAAAIQNNRNPAETIHQLAQMRGHVPAASTQRLQRRAEGHRQAMSLGNMRGAARRLIGVMAMRSFGRARPDAPAHVLWRRSPRPLISILRWVIGRVPASGVSTLSAGSLRHDLCGG